MITSVKIDGFKSFDRFALDLKPFTVLAGPNNGGKSNLLEAIGLLRDLALEGDDRALVDKPRGTGSELFRRADDGTQSREFSIHADYLEPDASDLSSIDVTVRLKGEHQGFEVDVPRDVVRSRWRAAWLRSWISINPDPAKMRTGASFDDRRRLAADGSNLAAVIARIFERGQAVAFNLDAAFVIGDLVEVNPVRDERRNQWDFDLIMRGGRTFTPTLVSDGTLRVIALLAAVHDPLRRGVLMIEEMENGLHPEYQGRLCTRLYKRVAEFSGLQIMTTTHSPVVVARCLELDVQSVVFLDQVAGAARQADGSARARHRTRARRVPRSTERGTYVPPVELTGYLTAAGTHSDE